MGGAEGINTCVHTKMYIWLAYHRLKNSFFCVNFGETADLPSSNFFSDFPRSACNSNRIRSSASRATVSLDGQEAILAGTALRSRASVLICQFCMCLGFPFDYDV